MHNVTLTAAQELIQSFYETSGNLPFHGSVEHCKAPHAYRGTPPRRRFDRQALKAKQRENAERKFREGLMLTQDEKYRHSSRRK